MQSRSVDLQVLWDWHNTLFFAMVSKGSCVCPFIIKNLCTDGEIPYSLIPQQLQSCYLAISLDNGHLCVRHKNGSIDSVVLKAKECELQLPQLMESSGYDSDLVQAEDCVKKLLDCGQYQNAWCLAIKYNQKPWIEDIGNSILSMSVFCLTLLSGKACLESMNISLALEAYRLLNKPTIVRKLTQLEHVEEWNLLAGHLLAVLGEKTDRAQVV